MEDSIEDTWIISGQSPTQKKLLKEHNVKEPIYIEGAFTVWLRSKPVNYFVLRANPKPVPIAIEDLDGNIFETIIYFKKLKLFEL